MNIEQISQFEGRPTVDGVIPKWNNDTKKFEYTTIGVLLEATTTEYIYEFKTASTSWLISHDIDGYPTAIVLNDDGQVMISEITYDTDLKTITVTHGSEFTGKVIVKLLKSSE